MSTIELAVAYVLALIAALVIWWMIGSEAARIVATGWGFQ